ncbi:hypothetical protein GCU60_06305 [Blastococcus saxobsidens]|uniref:Uncharacterized protein n=1 Tax=Blastococcus saxobsidens TaxID=138336 RepID=A0A6L9VZW3_9ACTN|nr:hypothetical protein [Blastococcus saxobsidens]NEK85375.1 hypothetical protein [Blastococcus saxobsidens]
MDVPAATAWLVLGAVLGALLVAAVVAGVLAARRRPAPPPAEAHQATPQVDDLADFLEHPPGTRAEPPAPTGWATLAAPLPAPAPPPPADRSGRGSLPLAALCVAALALVGVAAAVAAATDDADSAAPAAPPTPGPGAEPADPARLEGRLGAGGMVLEQRVVGVTATYPEIRLRDDDGTTHLELRLPTWNCLRAEAPEDPAAAGCVPSLVEHVELSSPELAVERDGDRIRLSGRAAAELRPAGAPPEPSGHTYEFEVTVAPGDAAERPLTGEVRIGARTAPLVAELSELDAG